MNATAWRIACVAACLSALGMGARQAFGMFVSPLNTASGLGLATLSLALALGQLGIGVAQPVIGRWADRAGTLRVVLGGSIVLALSMAMPAIWLNPTLVFSAVVVSAVAGSAVGSNGLLLGPVTRAASPRHAGLAVGIVGAGASVGQLVLAPLVRWLMDEFGWQAALLSFAGIGLAALPLAFGMKAGTTAPVAPRTGSSLSDVLREWTFWRYAVSFAVCGVHVSFLVAHMPGVIERCGFPAALSGPWIAIAGASNIAGSIGVGLALKRLNAGRVLASLYLMRAASIAVFLLLPSSLASLMGFAVLMGASHMATLPPTSTLVAQKYGTARLGSLFGVVMLVHQAGAFGGVWLGGVLAARTGHDAVFWAIDIALAAVAATLVLPVWARLQRGESSREVFARR